MTITVAAIQKAYSGNIKKNFDEYFELIKQAQKKGADIIVLPELFQTEYFCQIENTDYFDYAENIDSGNTIKKLSQLSKQLKIVLVASLFEKRAAGLYHNTAVVFDRNGETAGKYRKMHIPDDPGFYEKFYFTPGDTGFEPIQTSICRLGVLICWDQWYPEAARLMAMKHSDILIYPTAIGWEPADDESEKKRQLDAWITVQRSHSIANGLPLISVNRTGLEKAENGAAINFWGNTFISGPQGEILANASAHKQEIILAEINLSRTESVRRIWPFFRDRRIDAYSDLTKRFL